MKSVQEMIEVMTHYDNGGEVEERCELGANRNWKACSPAGPLWNWEVVDYRIAKPAPKKIKLLAWFDGCSLFWRVDGGDMSTLSKRVPSKDMEIEVE